MPEHYNIAADVCDKHPRDKPAMVWEDFRGSQRRVSWGSAVAVRPGGQRAPGSRRGTRRAGIAVVAPATPETGTWKVGAILLSMSVLYGDELIRHQIEELDCQADHLLA